MRLNRTAIAFMLTGVLLGAAMAAMSWANAGAAPEYTCKKLKGTIVTPLEIPAAGTVTGSYAGTIEFKTVENDFSNPGGTQNIRSVFTGTITPDTGAPFDFMMDLVAVNWTASGLVGGGVLSVAEDQKHFTAIQFTLGPMDDRFGHVRTFKYRGQRCKG